MCLLRLLYLFFCFKQKTAYEMRISDLSSDVCSSDLMVTISPATSLWMSMTIGTMKSCTSLRNKVAPSTEPRWKYHSTPRSYCHALNGFRLKLPPLPNHPGSAPNSARSNTNGSELKEIGRAHV